jgi:hypothetical protein
MIIFKGHGIRGGKRVDMGKATLVSLVACIAKEVFARLVGGPRLEGPWWK